MNEDEPNLYMDGVYYSELQEIIGIEFVGESTIMAVFEGADGKTKETKLLYAAKFYPGDYLHLEEDYRQ